MPLQLRREEPGAAYNRAEPQIRSHVMPVCYPSLARSHSLPVSSTRFSGLYIGQYNLTHARIVGQQFFLLILKSLGLTCFFYQSGIACSDSFTTGTISVSLDYTNQAHF